ncbi:MAG: Flp pilus assembly protein CpaB [Bacillota bacterium]
MKPKVVVIIAIILGLITSILVYTMLGPPKQQEQEKTKMATVIVAQDNIKTRQKITSDMIEIKEVPQERVHFQALQKSEEVTGRYASDKIIAGEQILKSRLYDEQESSSIMAFNLGSKERAVTVAVDEITGVAGFLMPGDYVDVVGVFSGADNQTVGTTVLQNVKVLAVAQDMTANKNAEPKVQKSVTLAVGLSEAEKLILADREGQIRLALRSPKNKIREGSMGLSLENLIGQQEEQEAEQSDESAEQKSKTTKQSKESQTKEEQSKEEDISKTVEIIRGLDKSYEQIFIKSKEGN